MSGVTTRGRDPPEPRSTANKCAAPELCRNQSFGAEYCNSLASSALRCVVALDKFTFGRQERTLVKLARDDRFAQIVRYLPAKRYRPVHGGSLSSDLC